MAKMLAIGALEQQLNQRARSIVEVRLNPLRNLRLSIRL